MKDFLGQSLAVGDEVACIEVGYNNLRKAYVVKLTEKTIFVEYMKWKKVYGPVKRTSDQVVKI